MTQPTQTPLHRHQAFGLVIASTLPLPELLPAGPEGAVDIEIVEGEVPAELAEAMVRKPFFQAGRDQLLLTVAEIARYHVRDGRKVTFQREPGVEDDEVKVFLLGSALGAILHQRDDLVLHGSAVVRGGEAVAFLGRSGIGKSTLAAALRKRGCPLLTDDLCVVRRDAEGRMLAYPGFPQMKLWLDALEQLDLSTEGLRRILRKLDKRAVPLSDDFSAEPKPLRKVYVLRRQEKDEISIAPLVGPRKFAALKNQTYRLGFLVGIDDKIGHFQLAMQVAQQVPVAGVLRPIAPYRLDELVATIEKDLDA